MDSPQIPEDNAHVLKIGICPETEGDAEVVLKDTRPPRVRRRQPLTEKGPKLFVSADATVERAGDLVSPNGESLTSLTWPKYLGWRKTKCRPFDYTNAPRLATSTNIDGFMGEELVTTINRDRGFEEIDQATHEFVGELAELGELFLTHGASTFLGENRDKLIDECGDILFCGAWALDAWGKNPLVDADDLELVRVSPESELARMAEVIGRNPRALLSDGGQFIGFLQRVVLQFLLAAQSQAGLLCNAYKKLRYQRREQDVDQQVARVCGALLVINQILIIANSSIEEALKVNQAKLNASYPNGYVAGHGGGDRTGKGA